MNACPFCLGGKEIGFTDPPRIEIRGYWFGDWMFERRVRLCVSERPC